jgi:predicted NUDIX family NTP pyrophosphohydrolase
MASKTSAGILLHRVREGVREVFLVHPGGPFWARKDALAWSIPKGEYEQGEDPRAVALRESKETGQAWATMSAAFVVSRAENRDCLGVEAMRRRRHPQQRVSSNGRRNRPAARISRRAGWFALAEARRKILPGQAPLLDELERLFGGRGA